LEFEASLDSNTARPCLQKTPKPKPNKTQKKEKRKEQNQIIDEEEMWRQGFPNAGRGGGESSLLNFDMDRGTQ
jgi:hypothetical protein